MARRINTPFADESGFTLVELIVVLVVGSILVLAINPILSTTIRSYETVTTVSESAQAARIGFNRMLNDLRMVRSPSDVTEISSSAITFADVKGNIVTYAWTGGRLLRDGYLLTDHVSQFQIIPKDSAGVALDPIAGDEDVYSYEVRMTVEAQTGNRVLPMRFQAEVTPRNFHP